MFRSIFLQLVSLVLLISVVNPALSAQGTRFRAETKLDQVYQQYDLSGQGTLVVMIDRGIDYHHPAYLNPDGTTRLAYVYDMINPDGANAAGNSYGVGTIFTESDINADLMTDGPPLSNDNHGHGTATTGIIAGNGAGSNGNDDFSGVAPEATIISIKMVQDGFPASGSSPGETGFFDPDYIAIALQFAADKIEELGLPSVTLMNIGSIGGPTDGTSTVSRAIAAFAAEYPFVCGVGDDGGADNVSTSTLDQGETKTIRIRKETAGNMDIGIWYPSASRINARLTTPGSGVLTTTAPAGNTSRTEDAADNVTMWNNGAGVDFFGATSNRREIFIRIANGTGTFTLELTGAQANATPFIATMNPAYHGLPNRFLDFATNEYSINDYSATPGVISPGDYVVNPVFMSVDGNAYGGNGAGAPGEIWSGSSKGPTQDDRLGIDFVAPGEILFGPYSPGSFYHRFASNRVAGGNDLYGIQSAVSAAAPLSTGVIALMVEQDPTLTPPEILDILQRTARSDNFTGATPNTTFGYGKIDAKAAIDEVARLVGTREVQLLATALTLFPNPTANELTINFTGGAAGAVEIMDALGRMLQSFELANTPTVDVSGFQPGHYTVRLRTQAGVASRSFLKL